MSGWTRSVGGEWGAIFMSFASIAALVLTSAAARLDVVFVLVEFKPQLVPLFIEQHSKRERDTNRIPAHIESGASK